MRISFITVVLNDCDNIERTITSIINQKRQIDQYIVIDGGSSDGTTDIINRYSEKIDVYICEKDTGIYNAMNKGINLADGDIINFMNSGDLLEVNTINTIEEVYSEYDFDVLCGRALFYGKDISDDRYCGFERIPELDMLYVDNLFCHQSMFIKKECFSRIGLFDESYRIYGDYDWNLRAYENNMRFLMVMDVFARYLSGGVSGEYSVYEEYKLIQKRYPNSKLECKSMITLKMMNCYVWDILIKVQNKNDFILPFSQYKKIYIWGAGRFGKKLYEILETFKVRNCEFIDIHRTKVSVNDVEIQCLNSIDTIINSSMSDDYLFIVSTPKFCNEIVYSLKNNGVSSANYMTIFEFCINCLAWVI